MYCRYILTMNTDRNPLKFKLTIIGDSSLKIQYMQNHFNKYYSPINNTCLKFKFKEYFLQNNLIQEAKSV